MKRLLTALFLAACLTAGAAEETNLTYSPDSTLAAFTRAGNLYLKVVKDGREIRLTCDGSSLVMNGYAQSDVHFMELIPISVSVSAEEIFDSLVFFFHHIHSQPTRQIML